MSYVIFYFAMAVAMQWAGRIGTALNPQGWWAQWNGVERAPLELVALFWPLALLEAALYEAPDAVGRTLWQRKRMRMIRERELAGITKELERELVERLELVEGSPCSDPH